MRNSWQKYSYYNTDTVTCSCQQSSYCLLGWGPFLWTELAIPGYRVRAISSNYSATAVVTVAVSSPSSLPLLPFASKATPTLTLFCIIAALVQVQTLTVSAFAIYVDAVLTNLLLLL